MSCDKTYEEGGIKYGIKFSSDTVVFLKTGKGATIYGENEEQSTLYLDLMEKIFQEFGYTVFVANNPLECDMEDPLIKDEGILKQIFPNVKEIVYVGYSSGANFGAWYGRSYEKMLLINPILNMNFHKLQRTCE